MIMDVKTFCKTIRSRRLELGLSQKAVAEAIGIEQSAYYRYDHGLLKYMPDDETVKKIAEALQTTVEELNKSYKRKEEWGILDRLPRELADMAYSQPELFDKIIRDGLRMYKESQATKE